MGDWRLEIGDWRLEIGDGRLEIGDWRLEIGDWRLEIGELEIGELEIVCRGDGGRDDSILYVATIRHARLAHIALPHCPPLYWSLYFAEWVVRRKRDGKSQRIG